MAAPVTHVVLADLMYEKYFSDKDKTGFFVGTCYPDIRRLGKIDRYAVHYTDFDFADTRTGTAFISGLKFHSVVDLVSYKYTEDNNLPGLFSESIFTREAVKLFSDRVLFKKITDWEEIVRCFDRIYPEELTYGITEADVKTWHKMLAAYFTSDITSDRPAIDFIMGNGTPKKIVTGIVKAANTVNDINKAEELILHLYNNFEKLVTEY